MPDLECSNHDACWNTIKVDKVDLDVNYFCEQCIDEYYTNNITK